MPLGRRLHHLTPASVSPIRPSAASGGHHSNNCRSRPETPRKHPCSSSSSNPTDRTPHASTTGGRDKAGSPSPRATRRQQKEDYGGRAAGPPAHRPLRSRTHRCFSPAAGPDPPRSPSSPPSRTGLHPAENTIRAAYSHSCNFSPACSHPAGRQPATSAVCCCSCCLEALQQLQQQLESS